MDERLAAIRLILSELKLHTEKPVWSSDVLRQVINGVLAISGGTIGDLFQALSSVFADYPVDLTKPRASFINDLVVECFTRHRSAYESIDWEGFCQKLGENASRSQLYLALLAIPPCHLPAGLAAAIIAGLANTPYQDETIGLTDAGHG